MWWFPHVLVRWKPCVCWSNALLKFKWFDTPFVQPPCFLQFLCHGRFIMGINLGTWWVYQWKRFGWYVLVKNWLIVGKPTLEPMGFMGFPRNCNAHPTPELTEKEPFSSQRVVAWKFLKRSTSAPRKQTWELPRIVSSDVFLACRNGWLGDLRDSPTCPNLGPHHFTAIARWATSESVVQGLRDVALRAGKLMTERKLFFASQLVISFISFRGKRLYSFLFYCFLQQPTVHPSNKNMCWNNKQVNWMEICFPEIII